MSGAGELDMDANALAAWEARHVDEKKKPFKLYGGYESRK